MARIPIAEIPNVGNVPGPVLTDYPSARIDVGSGPAAANASLSRVAANGMQNPISERAFSAPGQALEQAGYAVGKAGGVFAELADQMANSKNYADIARAESIMDETKAAHAIKIQGLPEDQWVSTWENEFRPQVEKKIGELRLSQWAADRINPQMIQFDAKTRTDIAYSAHKQTLERDNADMINRQNKAFDEGRYEEAIAIQEMRVKAGHLTKEAADAETAKMEETIRERSDLQILNESPGAAADDLKQAMKTGESKMFPHLNKRPDLIRRNLAIAESNDRQIKMDASAQIEDEIFSGKLTDPKEVESRAIASGLPGKEVASLVAAASKIEETSPAGIAKTLKAHSELMTMIEGYDPSTDPKAEKFTEMRMMIRQNMPEGLREVLVSALVSRRKDGMTPDKIVSSEVMKEIERQADLGTFGKTKKNPDDKEDDPAMSIAVSQKVIAVKQAFRQWQKDNPKATASEAMDFFKNAVGGDAAKAAEKEIQERMKGAQNESWWSGGSYVDSISAGNLTADKKLPATVRNNNPGAQWFVGGWQEKYGATYGESLRDGLGQGNQIARFPSPVKGAAAQMHLLSNYGRVSVADAIQKWSGGNNVASYLSSLKAAGFNGDEALPDILKDKEKAIKFSRAMASHETGQDFPLSSSQWAEAYDTFWKVKHG